MHIGKRAGLVLMVLLAAAVALERAAAEAREPWPIQRRGDGYTYYEKRRTKGPEHGFEGYAGPPQRPSYCSYRRIPERTCDKTGCRVTSWTLEQWCQ